MRVEYVHTWHACMPSIIIGEKDIRQSGSKLAGLFILFSFSFLFAFIVDPSNPSTSIPFIGAGKGKQTSVY